MDQSQLERAFYDEVRAGKRYRFGRNWRSFSRSVGQQQVTNAEQCLRDFLAPTTLTGKTFLDIGCGSGLHSLAALRLGAQSVVSFDYDPDSVATARALKARFAPDATNWRIERGSVLDTAYLDSLGTFGIAYSWGVLHHTGEMWQALENVQRTVAPGGRLFIAIYADRGADSLFWLKRKHTYCALPGVLKPAYAFGVFGPKELKKMFKAVIKGRWNRYMERWRSYDESRGMSRWHDMLDWLGGYPYEFASSDRLVELYQNAGFQAERVSEAEGLGCHQLLFRRAGGSADLGR